MDKVTIKQAAKLLKISEQTVRRRINKGEIPAKKEMTEFGEVWFIPADFITAASSTVEVVSLTREVSLGEMERVMTYAIEEAVKKVMDEKVAPLHEEIRQLRAQLSEYHLRLEETKAPRPEPKGLFERLFNWRRAE